MSYYRFFIFILLAFLLALGFSGCVTVPPQTAFPTYEINGVTYYALANLCSTRDVYWNYDTYAKTVTLQRGAHKLSLMIGDKLVLVDGRAQMMMYPALFYQDKVVVPDKFKEQIFDATFPDLGGRRGHVYTTSRIKKIVIDAGHGGNDPGAIGKSGLREKDVTLDIAKRLANLLREDGFEVVLTRSSDRFVSLPERVSRTNRSNADLFISIHVNANRVRSLSGFEVYYVSPTVSDTKRALETAEIARPVLDRSCFASDSADLNVTLWDMIYNSNRAESIQLSRSICRTVRNNLDTRVIGVKDARYYVLKGARTPAVLIEVGFVSNREEERMLKNGYYRQVIAENIRNGIKDYAQTIMLSEVTR